MNRCQELFEELQNLQNQVSRKEKELEEAQAESMKKSYEKNYSYWASHGGINGKCFKYRENFAKRGNYYRVHNLVDNGFKGQYPMVALEHIILDDDSNRWPFYQFSWDECFALSIMKPENEISLSEFSKAKDRFNEQYKCGTSHIMEKGKRIC